MRFCVGSVNPWQLNESTQFDYSTIRQSNSIKLLLFVNRLLRAFQSYRVMLQNRYVGEGEG